MSKTILITGASSGIGKASAIYFAEKGWNVVATMRKIQEFEGSNFANILYLSLDVTDELSIKNAIDSTLKHFGSIDVLFNNAGYALAGAFEAMTQEQIKAQFETNVFGVMNVTRCILPYFRTKNLGIIINTSSMGGLITFPTWSAYHATKWALEGFMESLQYELRQFNIKIKNIEPGAIQSDFGRNMQNVSMHEYDNYIVSTQKNMMSTYDNAPTSDVVAKVVYDAANDQSFKLRYTVAFQSKVLLLVRRLVPDSWFFALVRMATERKGK